MENNLNILPLIKQSIYRENNSLLCVIPKKFRNSQKPKFLFIQNTASKLSRFT